MRVEGRSKARRGQPSSVLEVGHLAFGVSPGVGPPRGVELRLLPRHLVDGAPQLPFDRAMRDLKLPAGELGTVIFEEQADVSQVAAALRSRSTNRLTAHCCAALIRLPATQYRTRAAGAKWALTARPSG